MNRKEKTCMHGVLLGVLAFGGFCMSQASFQGLVPNPPPAHSPAGSPAEASQEPQAAQDEPDDWAGVELGQS